MNKGWEKDVYIGQGICRWRSGFVLWDMEMAAEIRLSIRIVARAATGITEMGIERIHKPLWISFSIVSFNQF